MGKFYCVSNALKMPMERAFPRGYLLASLLGALLITGCASRFDLQGHRGARGDLPENTLPAFAHALDVGVDTLELDVGISADGVVVVTHDRSLNPAFTRDASGQWLKAPTPTVRSLTMAQLRTYDVGRIDPSTPYAKTFAQQKPLDGTRMPTLAEVFALARSQESARGNLPPVRFNIETKLSPLAPQETVSPEAFARAVIAEIRRAGMAQRSTVQSFDWRTLQVVQREAPEIATVYLSFQGAQNSTVAANAQGQFPWLGGFKPSDYGNSVPRMVKAAGGAVWSPNFRDVTPENLAEAKRLSLPVVVWTVNEPADIKKMLEMGVDGIISDYPARVKQQMAGPK
jgi:glycerophosphoryl diester phosphodiesterase